MTHLSCFSRRDFFKLNALVGGALAASIVLPAAASASTDTQVPRLPLHMRFGTPTDVAATWAGEAWSVDAEGTIRKFDRRQRMWLPDDDAADFPIGSELVLTRWGRSSGPNQMLMVLGQTP